MQKWKQDYPLLKNESGITLVELLAVIALMSIVIMLGGAVHMFGQRQFRAQTESASQNNDLSYAMTMMSSDLRKVPSDHIEVAQDNLIKVKDGPIYKVENNVLSRNSTPIAESVHSMKVIKSDAYISIDLILRDSTTGVNNKDYRTTIYFRDEGESDDAE
jgi:type II secretory pathway pseudopilin PulG